MEQSIKEIEKWIRDVRYKTEDSPLSDYDLRKYGDLAQIIDGYQGKIISLTYELEDLIAARKTGTQLQHQNPWAQKYYCPARIAGVKRKAFAKKKKLRGVQMVIG